MPARDHRGVCLPPAEKPADVKLRTYTDDEGHERLLISTDSGSGAHLSEPQIRGLICELWAAWARAFKEVHS